MRRRAILDPVTNESYALFGEWRFLLGGLLDSRKSKADRLKPVLLVALRGTRLQSESLKQLVDTDKY